MTQRYSPDDDLDNDETEYSIATTAAWDTYRAHPDVISAQRQADAREQELEPVKRFYNDELTRAKLIFQEKASVPLLALTKELMEIDARFGRISPDPQVP